jgi:hypothetical protein
MKLNQIINESTDKNNPTDLTGLNPTAGNKYPANFYTGKKGAKTGKIVLGYTNLRGDFRTTDPVASISQSKSRPDIWLVQTLRVGVPYFYLMYMPVATMKATCGWYLKGKRVSLILQSPDGIPKDYMNVVTYSRNERGELENKLNTAYNTNYPWSYYDGTMIEIAKRPAKPKTSVEAYNYLMYWAYSNSQPKDDDTAAHYAKLVYYLETGKKLKSGIRDVTAKYPKAKDAVIAKLKEKAKEEKQFELNLEPDDEAPAEQPAVPAAAEQPAQAQTDDDSRGLDSPFVLDQQTTAATENPTQEAEADQTTSNAAAETTNTRSYHREFGGMPDNRGAKPPPPTGTEESEDDKHDRRHDGYKARWAFEAMDSRGVELKDAVDAATEEEAIAKIRQMGYHVTKIKDRYENMPKNTRSFWQRFKDSRTAKGLRKVFWPEKDD